MVFILFFITSRIFNIERDLWTASIKKKTPANRYTEIIAYTYHQN